MEKTKHRKSFYFLKFWRSSTRNGLLQNVYIRVMLHIVLLDVVSLKKQKYKNILIINELMYNIYIHLFKTVTLYDIVYTQALLLWKRTDSDKTKTYRGYLPEFWCVCGVAPWYRKTLRFSWWLNWWLLMLSSNK